jgi:hypothetical protein
MGASGDVLQLSSNGALFTVPANVTLTLQDIELRGRAGNNRAVVVVNGGTLNMNDGAKITGNTNTTTTVTAADMQGGGVNVHGTSGTFNMNAGAEISGNTAVNGGGVEVSNSGTFNMFGGLINNNQTTTGQGGGVRVTVAGTADVANRSFFNMHGGTISNNRAVNGGGVSIPNVSIFEMHAPPVGQPGGTISGNRALGSGTNNAGLGGGVYLTGSSAANVSTFIMRGGTISGNTAENRGTGGGRGGGVYNFTQGRFRLHGGTIHGNTALHGGGVMNENTGTFSMSGGVISGNRALQGAGVANMGSTISVGVFVMNNGTIYGFEAQVNPDLRNFASNTNHTQGLGHAVASFNTIRSQIVALDVNHAEVGGALFNIPTCDYTLNLLNVSAATMDDNIIWINFSDIPTTNPNYTGHGFSLHADLGNGEFGRIGGWAFGDQMSPWAWFFSTPGTWDIRVDIHTMNVQNQLVSPPIATYTIPTRNYIRGDNFVSYNEFIGYVPPPKVGSITITDLPAKYQGRGGEVDLFAVVGGSYNPLVAMIPIVGNSVTLTPVNPIDVGTWTLNVEFWFPPFEDYEAEYEGTFALVEGPNTISYNDPRWTAFAARSFSGNIRQTVTGKQAFTARGFTLFNEARTNAQTTFRQMHRGSQNMRLLQPQWRIR